jgi:hypothetical protein
VHDASHAAGPPRGRGPHGSARDDGARRSHARHGATGDAARDRDDPCDALEAWRRAGFAPSAAPVDLDALEARDSSAAEDKIARAARRTQRLGVSPGAARRYTAAGMFRGVLLDLF